MTELKKLCRIEVSINFPVFVYSDGDAAELRRCALNSIADELDNFSKEDWDVSGPELVTELKHVPEEWRDSLPYGDIVDDATIRDILEPKP